MTQTLILLAAVSGSVLYLFDRIAALIKRGKETKEKQSEQLTEVLRLKDAKIEELQARIRFLESSLRDVRRQRAEQIASSARPARPADPVAREAEAKAEEAMAEARNIALAAIDASGREKSRLIAQARKLAERANEYRRVARGELPTPDQVQAQAQGSIGKTKQGSAGAAQFEVLSGE
jgi:uncharacterized iron-regulated membrane protein